MQQILEFIVAHLAFLWEEARFSIVGSEVTTSNGGDSSLQLESSVVRMRFVRDRGQLFLDFQPKAAGRTWYSIDLVWRLLMGGGNRPAVMDAEYAEFLHQHLGELEDAFGAEGWRTTRGRLQKLRAQRAEEMFG